MSLLGIEGVALLLKVSDEEDFIHKSPHTLAFFRELHLLLRWSPQPCTASHAHHSVEMVISQLILKIPFAGCGIMNGVHAMLTTNFGVSV